MRLVSSHGAVLWTPFLRRLRRLFRLRGPAQREVNPRLHLRTFSVGLESDRDSLQLFGCGLDVPRIDQAMRQLDELERAADPDDSTRVASILCVEDDARLFRYRIDEQSMMPLENYEGSIHVTDLGGGTCEVLWFATYNLLDEGADAAVRDGLLGLLRTAIGGMGALVTAA